MLKEITKKSTYIGVFILFLIGVISCEKDFNDIGSSVINNTKFNTKDTILEVIITNKEIKSVRADGLALGGTLGQYLLGVYNNPDYEKVEASIISQLVVTPGIKLVEKTYGADTTVVSTIDTVYLKLPYQATLKESNSNVADYNLDSIIGDQTKAFNLNIYQSNTYLSRLNPTDPSKANSYLSNFPYQKLPSVLNLNANYQFRPNAKDTAFLVKRKLSNGLSYRTDTITLPNRNPFARIPLDKNKIKQLFLDKYGSSDFATQEAFDQYFKGLYIEASGNEGSLISFSVTNSNAALKPSLEIHYTNTVLKGGTTIIDTIQKTNSYNLSNFSNSIYKMNDGNDKTYPENGNIVLQGTGGNMANVTLFGPDTDNNGIADQIEALRKKNWLINDASLTFYVNQNIVDFDTIAIPYRLYLYKDPAPIKPSQIIDVFTEGQSIFGGNLELSEKKPNKYTFRITDYVSDLLANTNNTNYIPMLGLKVYNSTDGPARVTDTIVEPYSWNPKVVTLLNHDKLLNGERRAQLKISYSIKK